MKVPDDCEFMKIQFERAKKSRRKLNGFFVMLTLIVFIGVAWYLRLTGITVTQDAQLSDILHTHSESCYANTYICGKENDPLHIHDESCCEKVLICTIPELKAQDLIGNSDADRETAEIWENTLPENKTGNFALDIIAVAESQSGYTESKLNFIYDEAESVKKGYTRYGEWYGNPYGDWSAMFASFCLYYSGVNNSVCPYSSGCYAWVAKLNNKMLYREFGEYTPQPGDLVFLKEESKIINTVGIITSVALDADGTVSMLTAVVGDSDDTVQRLRYTASDGNIAGYCELPENNTPMISPDLPELQSDKYVIEPSGIADEVLLSAECTESPVAPTTEQANAPDAESSGNTQFDDNVYSYEDDTAAFVAHSDSSELELQAPETELIPLQAAAPRVYIFTDERVIITVTVPTEALIPEGAVFFSEYVPATDSVYSNTVEKSQDIADGVVLQHMVYKIGFYLNGTETELSGGNVDVRFELNATALKDTEHTPNNLSVQVVHIADGTTAQTVSSQAVIEKNGSVSSVDFSADGFSEYDIMLLALSTLPAGNYGPCTFAYNTQENAFTQNSAYASYYNSDCVLGVAGCFSLVAYDTLTLSSHCNGNVLANTLIANSNFGTNGITNELSYIVNYSRVNGVNASSNNHILVIGSNNTVTTRDNGNSLAVNDKKIDRPRNLIQDEDSDSAPFINMDDSRAENTAISASLGSMPTSGVTANFSDINNMYVSLSSPEDAGYYNMTAAQLNAIGGNARNLKMRGFESGCDGSIVVNVNCTGFTGTLSMPNSTLWLDGIEQATSEVTEFSNGKVIWNFINAAGLTIETNRMTGMILAPYSTVNIRQNINGTVIANNLNLYAESHRTDFTGTIIPSGYIWSVALGGIKTIAGEPAGTENFSFELFSLSTANAVCTWQTAQAVYQSGGVIEFTSASITSAGTYWYCITEQQTGPPGFSYSDAVFIVKAVTGSKLTADISYYILNENQTKETLVASGSVNTQYLTAIPLSALSFDNQPSVSYTLPSTGGNGTAALYFFGLALMLAALILLFFRNIFIKHSARKASEKYV